MKNKLKVHEEHKKKAPKKNNIALIVVSTSRFKEINSGNVSTDKTIPKVTRFLKDDPSISIRWGY